MVALRELELDPTLPRGSGKHRPATEEQHGLARVERSRPVTLNLKTLALKEWRGGKVGVYVFRARMFGTTLFPFRSKTRL